LKESTWRLRSSARTEIASRGKLLRSEVGNSNNIQTLRQKGAVQGLGKKQKNVVVQIRRVGTLQKEGRKVNDLAKKKGEGRGVGTRGALSLSPGLGVRT